MNKEKIINSLTICYIILQITCNVFATSIGTAPGVYDLGLVNPGEEITFRYYLMTNSKGDILVNAKYIPVHRNIYFTEKTKPYKFIPSEASEEDIIDWVEVVKSPVLVSPAIKKLIYLPGGSVVRANGEIDIRLKIPKDAEPGYHAGSINLAPQIPTRGKGTGVTTFAVTRPTFVFQVSGNAVRKGEIMNIIADRTGKNSAKIDVIFKNTGTTTISIKLVYLKIFDKIGNVIATLNSGLTYSSPGEIKPISVNWVSDKVKSGKYRVEAKISYTTGYTTHVQDIEIPERITISPKKKKAEVKEVFPTCEHLVYIIIFLIVLSVIIYFLMRESRILIILAILIFITVLWYMVQCMSINLLNILLIVIIIALLIYFIWG